MSLEECNYRTTSGPRSRKNGFTGATWSCRRLQEAEFGDLGLRVQSYAGIRSKSRQSERTRASTIYGQTAL